MKKNNGRYKEDELVRLIGQKNRGAIKFLYDRYAEYLSAVCGRYIADEDARKDVLQECFIKIFMSVSAFEYRGEGSLKAWMARITVNESLKFLRKSATYNFIEYGDNVPDTAEEPEVEGVPDDVINKMILSLPPGYRMVFNLYVFENKSHKEIGRLLNIGESSSASQFSRAKALLVKRIKEYKTAHKND
ncbi:RNA polymerase sigma factor [uncultured Prevotella sp.]|uniref:RNA polymerase sigma factor n=1 Tax=uncultured Prevotella sp. TaxID=159272 RepID=UPI0026074C55|nr:RNA polymerase sigma factor [uncultured Prevotella sp.]